MVARKVVHSSIPDGVDPVVVEWNESLATGSAELDRQHRRLIDLANELDAAESDSHISEERLRTFVEEIIDFANDHFLQEEEFMREVGYPPELIQRMIEVHRGFTARARELVLDFRAAESVDLEAVHASVTDWLVHHVFTIDRELGEWVRSRDKARSE